MSQEKTVLILTEPGDVHGLAVATAIQRKGAQAVLWYTPDFPSLAAEAVLVEGGKMSVHVKGPELDLVNPQASTVWRRRPAHSLNAAQLHPADLKFASTECAIFRRSLFSVLSPSAFWVNALDAASRASHKILQHALGLEIGLDTPDTLYGNDPEAIRQFIRRHGGRVVFKPFHAAFWEDETTAWLTYTSLLTEDMLVSADLLHSSPGIFQEFVPKAFELRVTMIGQRCFAAKIMSQQTNAGTLDWRKAYGELQMEPYNLPQEIQAMCRALMARLGIVFGCFDFIVTPGGRYVFLEVNEMGQFLFVERYTRLPLLDAFSEFLIQGRLDFDWKEDANHFTYQEADAIIQPLAAEAVKRHVAAPPDSTWEGKS